MKAPPRAITVYRKAHVREASSRRSGTSADPALPLLPRTMAQVDRQVTQILGAGKSVQRHERHELFFFTLGGIARLGRIVRVVLSTKFRGLLFSSRQGEAAQVPPANEHTRINQSPHACCCCVDRRVGFHVGRGSRIRHELLLGRRDC